MESVKRAGLARIRAKTEQAGSVVGSFLLMAVKAELVWVVVLDVREGTLTDTNNSVIRAY